MLFCFIFFFKQKTAYDMRISDWSSDVCSSDLHRRSWLRYRGGANPARPAEPHASGADDEAMYRKAAEPRQMYCRRYARQQAHRPVYSTPRPLAPGWNQKMQARRPEPQEIVRA